MHILSEEIVNYCNTRLKISEIEEKVEKLSQDVKNENE